ncbi:MAG: N-acetyltransferase [Dehalococcoidales bacterium]|jgi:amino-acid N-acetyltransferase
MEYSIEKARITDAAKIHKMVNHFAANGKMLARSLSEIYENIRDYFVTRLDGEVIACIALHISWNDLAEIKSLAVNEEHQKLGIGEQMVVACLEEAKEIGIPTVFCLTYVPNFFAKCGFEMVDKRELPHKIWGECYRCPNFPDCDESALVYRLEKQG